MATQITATLPTLDFPREADYPKQEDWAEFSAIAEENYGILGGSWSEQMQLWKEQANAMSTELNTNATIAQGLANYQGDWVSQGYTLNQTVSVGEIYYICKLTHATGQNPTDIDSLYWNLALGNWNLKADKIEVALKIDKDISPYTSKTTPIDADLIPLSDSAASFGIKKLSWLNLKTTLSNLFAPLLSPAFTGNPTAPTQTAGNNSTRLATTAYVDGKMVRGTAVATTSGTAIDFTGIPSWAKRITIMFNGVSTNGMSLINIQIGTSSGVETTGYTSQASQVYGTNQCSILASTTGFVQAINASIVVASGIIQINNISGNTWTESGVLSSTDGVALTSTSAGVKTLAGVLGRVRITAVNGTDTFDAGSINILYEG